VVDVEVEVPVEVDVDEPDRGAGGELHVLQCQRREVPEATFLPEREEEQARHERRGEDELFTPPPSSKVCEHRARDKEVVRGLEPSRCAGE
jgi:hypothetical protein